VKAVLSRVDVGSGVLKVARGDKSGLVKRKGGREERKKGRRGGGKSQTRFF
jgi:hypothetical protein